MIYSGLILYFLHFCKLIHGNLSLSCDDGGCSKRCSAGVYCRAYAVWNALAHLPSTIGAGSWLAHFSTLALDQLAVFQIQLRASEAIGKAFAMALFD
jgi:hypothetical protein